jgi:hypothetical protein
MEVTRRLARFAALGLALGFLGAPGCYRNTPGDQVSSRMGIHDPAPKAGRETIAILMPFHAQTRRIHRSLVTDLSSDFNVATVRVEAGTTVSELANQLEILKPSCVVLMENRTVRLYGQLQRATPGRNFPPAVVLMTSFLDQMIGTLHDATGIAYEVPAVTGFVAVREIVKKPVHRIGVVHRKVFAGVVAAQAQLAAVEKLTLVGAEVADHPSLNAIDDALYELIHDRDVDALWVLNDNALLSRDALTEVWLPRLRDKAVPVVVGVSALVQPEVHFGTLAMLPDNDRMGSQAANLIFELEDNHWKIDERRVELPLSVRTVVDVGQLRHEFGLQPGALKKVDEALE